MIGMQQVTCNRQIRGDQAVSIGLIEGFLREFPKISAEWLLRGNGSMVINAQSKPLYKNDLPSESIWQAKYDELEKRYGQLLAVLGGDINRQ